MDKGNCYNCGRKIQETLLDQCMFCGTKLLDSQIFTYEEKQKILAKKKARESERLEYENKNNKANIGPNSDSIFFGSICSSDGSGCNGSD